MAIHCTAAERGGLFQKKKESSTALIKAFYGSPEVTSEKEIYVVRTRQ